MTQLFEQVKNLYEQELYCNVVNLANLVLSLSDHNPDFFNSQTKFDLYIYYADSLFNLNEYRKAESVYRKALQLKKSILKSKGATKVVGNQKEYMYDISVKYNVHICHLKMKDPQQALLILQSIPGKQRTPKVNMALAKLYHQSGMDRSAVFAYKEVLRECPLALEAAEGLLKLSEHGTEVNTLILDGLSSVGSYDWLSTWLKALAFLHSREYNNAVTSFKSLDIPSVLADDPTLVVYIGECLYKAGDFKNALIYLQRAYNLDSYMQKGLDMLASLLAKEGRHKDIERLITSTLHPSEYSAENWVVLAYHMHVSKKWDKAAYFAQKACFLSPRNMEALILKGNILLDLHKYNDAILHFREAMQVFPNGFDGHKGLVDCYVATHRLREALSIACNACMRESSPRAYTLYASVFMKDPLETYKAKKYLEKALALDETHLPAVYLLAELYERELNFDPAIQMLERQLRLHSTCRLHRTLADLLARAGKQEQALEHYSIALNLDPNNRRAIEGIQRIDHANSSKLDSVAYSMSSPSAIDISNSGVGGDDVQVDSSVADESNTLGGGITYEAGSGVVAGSDREDSETEMEAVWSDMDFEAATNH